MRCMWDAKEGLNHLEIGICIYGFKSIYCFVKEEKLFIKVHLQLPEKMWYSLIKKKKLIQKVEAWEKSCKKWILVTELCVSRCRRWPSRSAAACDRCALILLLTSSHLWDFNLSLGLWKVPSWFLLFVRKCGIPQAGMVLYPCRGEMWERGLKNHLQFNQNMFSAYFSG